MRMLSLLLFTVFAPCAEPPAGRNVLHESRERPDLLDSASPAGLRIVQITADPDRSSWYV